MLPRVKINYANGSLGQVEAMADGCLGFIAIGAEYAKSPTGELNPYAPFAVKKLADLEAIGVTAENNPKLYSNVKDFYTEAGDGTELWIMACQNTDTFTSILDKDLEQGAKKLLKAANGKIRGLVVFKNPPKTKVAWPAINEDVMTALPIAQTLGDWATNELKAPIFTLIEGLEYQGASTALEDLTLKSYNRVGVVIGNTSWEPYACMGVVAGRIAASPVHRKISRVKDGAVKPLTIYVGNAPAELADVETVNDKGYITFRTFVGKSGYFIADDNLATAVADDYRSITNRRVVDKAYRIAYNTLINTLNDEVPISADGNLSPAWCTSLQGDVEQAIISNMTANGNLGNDPADTNDTGVKCVIDYKQPILSTSRLVVQLRVKPNGYAKYIDVELGFKTA